MRDLLSGVDVFLPNEAEARAIAGEGDVRRGRRALQEASGGWVVVKLGARGCLAVGPDGAELSASAPAVAVAADTTGAGDAFNAGLVTALSADARLAAAHRGRDPLCHRDREPPVTRAVAAATAGRRRTTDLSLRNPGLQSGR